MTFRGHPGSIENRWFDVRIVAHPWLHFYFASLPRYSD